MTGNDLLKTCFTATSFAGLFGYAFAGGKTPELATPGGSTAGSLMTSRLDGVSLLPLLMGDAGQQPDRMLFTHVGRWRDGEEAAHKYAFADDADPKGTRIFTDLKKNP